MTFPFQSPWRANVFALVLLAAFAQPGWGQDEDAGDEGGRDDSVFDETFEEEEESEDEDEDESESIPKPDDRDLGGQDENFGVETTAITSGIRAGLAPSNRTTTAIVAAIGAGAELCRNLPGGYQVDCIAGNLRDVANSLPTTGAYSEAREILDEASRSLTAIVTENLDPDQPPVYGQAPDAPRVQTSRPARAVQPEATEAALEQAIAILEEAETMLLRSAENSARRSVHYTRIAEALGSNKVLLRST